MVITLDGTDKCCWTCKHAIDEGNIWCNDMVPGNYRIIGPLDRDPNYGCEHWEEAEFLKESGLGLEE